MSKNENLFAIANDASLGAAIRSCQNRLVYIAPGITATLAAAIDELLQRAEPPAITVIIDTDPEVCRLGYGTEKGLKLLHRAVKERHMVLRTQPGIRLGVLMSDEQCWVYTPTPLLIEAGSDREGQPNAMLLGNPDLIHAVAMATGADGFAEEDIPLPGQAEIGRCSATESAIQETLQDLQQLPPKPYNLARIERVYTSKLQYVEMEVSGYKLSARRVQVPNDLLVGNDKILEERLHNSFALLEGKESLLVEIAAENPRTGLPVLDDAGNPKMVVYSEKQIDEDRKAIAKDFLTTIPGYGQLISRARREAFDVRINWFKNRIEAYRDSVFRRLDEAVKQSVDELVEALLPTIKRAPPERLLKNCLAHEPTDQDLREALKDELHGVFKTGEKFFVPSVKVIFKDLTYETIQDELFRQYVEASFKGLRASDFFTEFDAAPELSVVD
ncbi:hypothetical protein [Chitinilyticum aquatile]|uniref:hypothetical protein n=1 Tax=Chitinilyticum aquatile TaxID=362520 RepID=UPI00042079A1|nr:hypothetical protein [Chitinilyticum aquatile]